MVAQPNARTAATYAVLGLAIAISATNGDDGDRTGTVRDQLSSGRARNVILFIGDGLGDSEITIARNYEVGAAGRLGLDTLAFTGAYTTYALDEDNPRRPNYVTDSAASGTGWATGVKTSNGRISTSAGSDRDLTTVLEIARGLGYRTGDVTTAELTDATPAVLAAHVADRSCHGPADMAACPQDRKSVGGPGSIAEQEIDHDVDVLLGGGRDRFAQTTESGATVLDVARARGYRVIITSAELDSARPGERLLGLFAPENMTTEWTGDEALPYPGNVDHPQTCRTGQRPASEPSLATMTRRAIDLLERQGGGRGFFLQVEGASIDKQDHAANPCGQIGETIAFDHAVKIGLDYARAHRDTLVIVTADHAHTSQIVPIPGERNPPTGLISVLMTADRAPMAVAYGTSGYHHAQQHTGGQVRIAAEGPQAANVLGVTDQADLFRLMVRAMTGEGSPSYHPD